MVLFGRRAFLYLASLVVVLASVAFVTTPTTVGALDLNCDQDFLSGADIIMYNPCVSQCTSAKPEVVAVQKLRGKGNGEKVFNFLVDAGLSPQQAAGVTANLQDVSGLSAFYQQDGKSWPDGGWGIAGFTNDLVGYPGVESDTTSQRDAVTGFVKSQVPKDDFEKYYSSDYGGIVLESDGFVPSGVTEAVNDSFLLPELNYLLTYLKSYRPSYDPDKLAAYQKFSSKTVDDQTSLYQYLTSFSGAADVSNAWVYLYENHESGDKLPDLAVKRAAAAKDVLKLFGKGIVSGCGGGLVEGGMNLEQAKQFMAVYLQINDGDPNGDAKYMSSKCHVLTDNCVSFSSYFVRKYTTATFGMENGAQVVNKTLSLNPGMESGTDPQPYAVFGINRGKTMCGNIICGHTGVILGVDLERNVVIVGEAAYCGSPGSVSEQPLKNWTDGAHKYAYLQPYLKSDAEVSE